MLYIQMYNFVYYFNRYQSNKIYNYEKDEKNECH